MGSGAEKLERIRGDFVTVGAASSSLSRLRSKLSACLHSREPVLLFCLSRPHSRFVLGGTLSRLPLVTGRRLSVLTVLSASVPVSVFASPKRSPFDPADHQLVPNPLTGHRFLSLTEIGLLFFSMPFVSSGAEFDSGNLRGASGTFASLYAPHYVSELIGP